MTEFLTCTISCHSILAVMKQCRTRLRYVILIQSGCEPRWQVHLCDLRIANSNTKANQARMKPTVTYSRSSPAQSQITFLPMWLTRLDKTTPMHVKAIARWRVDATMSEKRSGRGEVLAEHLFSTLSQDACLHVRHVHYTSAQCTIDDRQSFTWHSLLAGLAQDRLKRKEFPRSSACSIVSCCLVYSGMHARYTDVFNKFLSFPFLVWTVWVCVHGSRSGWELVTDPKGI